MNSEVMPGCFFRLPADGQVDQKLKSAIEDEVKEKEADNGKSILCRQCFQVITSEDDRMQVQGAHFHTFANPGGIIYPIGCFRSVKGCSCIGPATEEWSWFKGFSWRIAVCSTCLTHLGWLFLSASQESFHGLILSRLIQAS